MNTCNDMHQMIAFDGQCPLCTEIAKQDDIRYLSGEIEGHVMDLLDELEG